jgi:hypothetical protein
MNKERTIPMDHAAFFVKIPNTSSYLIDHMSCQVFTKVRQLDNLVKKFAPFTKFKHQVIVVIRFGKMHQFDNVGMVDAAHDLYFFQNVGTLHTKNVNGFLFSIKTALFVVLTSVALVRFFRLGCKWVLFFYRE